MQKDDRPLPRKLAWVERVAGNGRWQEDRLAEDVAGDSRTGTLRPLADLPSKRPCPNGAIPTEHLVPNRQRPHVLYCGSPSAIAPCKPRKGHQLRFGHVEKLLEQGEFDDFAHDNEQRRSKMMFAREQEEADWFDRFQQQPRHEQQHECYICGSGPRPIHAQSLTHRSAIKRRRRGRSTEKKMKSIRKYRKATVRMIALPAYLRTLVILVVTVDPLPS